MNKVLIEWKYLDVGGETCDRCFDTGTTLQKEVRRLNDELQAKGVQVEWFETKLDKEDISQSNTLYLNGKLIEEIIPIEITESYCGSCSDLLDEKTYCRSVIFEGQQYEDIPAMAIRKAVFMMTGLEDEGPSVLMMPGF